jgi:hypothetical protein
VPGANLTSKVIHEQFVPAEFAFHVTFAESDVVAAAAGGGARERIHECLMARADTQ